MAVRGVEFQKMWVQCLHFPSTAQIPILEPTVPFSVSPPLLMPHVRHHLSFTSVSLPPKTVPGT